MDKKAILEIVKINQDFYAKHNESFDKSRSYGFWEGFEKINSYLPKTLKVLDLGCGNARFLKFLLEKNQSIYKYLGLDNSREFIKKNQENFTNYTFELKDVILDTKNLPSSFNTVVAFGITHHIPSKIFREQWFMDIASKVEKGGLLILSFWNFETSKSLGGFVPKHYKLEEGDYFLGWKSDYSKLRYCHLFSDSELLEIEELLNDLTLLSKFILDQNTYLIFKKD